MDPLEMANNCAAAVERVAEFQEREPLQARVFRVGDQGFQSAQLGACLALVSIARDVRRVVDKLMSEAE